MTTARAIAARRRARFRPEPPPMRALNNSEIPGFTAKPAELGSREYTEKVAAPVMGAVDAMPAAFRALANEFGYVDVYRAWRKGWMPAQVRAGVINGKFVL